MKLKHSPPQKIGQANISLGVEAFSGEEFHGFYNPYRDGVTQGVLARFLSCPEKHRLAMEEGLSPVRKSNALAFGTIVHEVLDYAYTYAASMLGSSPENIEHHHADKVEMQAYTIGLLESFEERDRERLMETTLSSPRETETIEANYGMAAILLENYWEMWESDSLNLKWESLEKEFVVPYVGPGASAREIPLRGKIDGIFRNKQSGRLWLFETKTKSRVEEQSIMDKLNFDLQVMMYYWVVSKLYGEWPEGILYNIIRKPQLRRGKSESLVEFLERCNADIQGRPEYYYIRYENFVSHEDRVAWVNDFQNIMAQFTFWCNGGFHYRNPCSCTGVYGDCEFLPLCSRGDDMFLQKRDVIFPELSGESPGEFPG